MLVNGECFGCRIVAGALQDHDRALIVGETTFGKGLVQYPYQLEYDSALLLTVAKYFTPSGRLIQRDYSNGGFYDYYTKGGSEGDKNATPVGPESHTDTGRPVYGGGGISPDEVVKATGFTVAQRKLLNPIFAFSLQLAGGRMQGFDRYVINSAIDYNHDIQPTDFPVSDVVFKALKTYVTSKPEFKVTAEQLDRDRAFVEKQLRYELSTAAFGSTTALQIYNSDDPQIARAVDVMPRARELALAALRAQVKPCKATINYPCAVSLLSGRAFLCSRRDANQSSTLPCQSFGFTPGVGELREAPRADRLYRLRVAPLDWLTMARRGLRTSVWR